MKKTIFLLFVCFISIIAQEIVPLDAFDDDENIGESPRTKIESRSIDIG